MWQGRERAQASACALFLRLELNLCIELKKVAVDKIRKDDNIINKLYKNILYKQIVF